MKPRDPLEQAEFICSTGQRIRNHFLGEISRKMGGGTNDENIQPLYPAQLQLLTIVIARGSITITGLANFLTVSRPSASAMVERMVQGGWLHRKRSAQDRRKVLVRATAKAEQHLRHHQECVHAGILNLIETLGPETAQKWCEVLSEIDRACFRDGWCEQAGV